MSLSQLLPYYSDEAGGDTDAEVGRLLAQVAGQTTEHPLRLVAICRQLDALLTHFKSTCVLIAQPHLSNALVVLFDAFATLTHTPNSIHVGTIQHDVIGVQVQVGWLEQAKTIASTIMTLLSAFHSHPQQPLVQLGDYRPLHALISLLFKPPSNRKLHLRYHQAVLPFIVKLTHHVRCHFSSTVIIDRLLMHFGPNMMQYLDIAAAVVASTYLTLYLPFGVSMPPDMDSALIDRVVAVMLAQRSMVQMRALDANLIDVLARVCQNTFTYQPSAAVLQLVFEIGHAWLELPIGSGLGKNESGAWTVGTKNVLSSGQLSYNNGALKQYEDAAVALTKRRIDKFKSLAQILVYRLDDQVLDWMQIWFQAIDPFLHPSNSGKWTSQLSRFLAYLCESMHSRVMKERTGHSKYPARFFLNPEHQQRFVRVMKPLLEVAVFGKDAISVRHAQVGLRHLAWLDPQQVLNDGWIHQHIFPSLVTLVEAHRTSSSIGVLSQLILPMTHRGHDPRGVESLWRVMELCLPGIDMNDPQKTFTTLIVYAKVFQVVSLCAFDSEMVLRGDSDSSRLSARPRGSHSLACDSGMDGDEQAAEKEYRETMVKVAEYSGYFEDFLHQFLDRLTLLIQTMPSMSKNATTEGNLLQVLAFVCDVLFRNLSKHGVDIVQEWLLGWVTGSCVFPAVKTLGQVISAFLAVHPHAVAPLLDSVMARVERELEDGLGAEKSVIKLSFEQGDGGDGGRTRGEMHQDGQLWYYLILLKAVTVAMVMCPDPDQKRHLTMKVVAFTRRTWEVCQSRTVFSVVSRVLRNMLIGLGSVFLIEEGVLMQRRRIVEDEEGGEFNESREAAHEAMWWGVSPYERVCYKLGVPLGSFLGGRYTIDEATGQSRKHFDSLDERKAFWQAMKEELGVRWHRPSQLDKEVILQTLKEFVEPQLGFLSGLIKSQPREDDQLQFVKSLTMLHHLVQSMAGLLAPDPASIKLTKRERSSGSMMMDVEDADSTEDLMEESTDDDDDDYSGGDDAGEDDSGSGGGSKRPVEAGYPFSDPQEKGYVYLVELRHKVGQVLVDLMRFMAHRRPDDVICYRLLLKIVYAYLASRGVEKTRFDAHMRSYEYTKNLMNVGSEREYKTYTRYMFLKRLELLHLARLKHNSTCEHGNLTEVSVVRDLLDMLVAVSVGSYAEIRGAAQSCLSSVLRCFPSMKYALMDKVFGHVEEALQKREATPAVEDTIKGALYVLTIRSFTSVYMRSWKYVGRFLNCICDVVSGPFDKPSIQELARNLTVNFMLQCGQLPFDFPRLAGDGPKFVDKMAETRRVNVERYEKVIKDLMERCEKPHWRLTLTVLTFFDNLLNRTDLAIRSDVLEFVLKSLNSELLPVRKAAVVCATKLMSLLKARSVLRSDGKYRVWLTKQQLEKQGPRSLELEQKLVVDGTEYYIDSFSDGWYVLPNSVKAYPVQGVEPGHFISDPESQPAVEVIKRYLESKAFWDTFLKFAAVESTSMNRRNNQPGDEVFSLASVRFYKVVFQILQDGQLYDYIAPIVESWANSLEEKAQQRACSELFTGLVLGSKLWSPEKQQRLWGWLTPLVRKVLLGCTPDTLGHWHQFSRMIMTPRDPKRIKPFIDLITRDPLFKLSMTSDSAFGEFKKLSFLRTVLHMEGWKIRSEAVRVLSDYVDAVDHRYKQVREMISSVLHESIRCCPWPANKQNKWVSMETFTQLPLDQMLQPMFEPEPEVTQAMEAMVVRVQTLKAAMPDQNLMYGTNMSHAMKTMLLLLGEGFASGVPHVVTPLLYMGGDGSSFLLDIFGVQASDDQDLSAQSVAALNAIPDINVPFIQAKTWISKFIGMLEKEVLPQRDENERVRRMKLRSLALLQVFSFRFLFAIVSDRSSEDVAHNIVNIVLRLLTDTQLEVRLIASITLSGLVRCFAASHPNMLSELRARFNEMCCESKNADSITMKHAGVLVISGLVQAYPYGIPVWLPDTLVQLAQHVSDPAPVGTTVKQIFADFRRTHQDTWQEDVIGGVHDDYVDLYGYGGEPAAQKRDVGMMKREKGVFTSEHLDALEGLLTSSASYYA